MRLFLVGMPGSGKTSVAKKISLKRKLYFFDTDKVIEEKYNKSISEIFGTEGEHVFRKYENELINSLQSKDKIVVATGGGFPCFFNNMQIMNRIGRTVYLKASPDVLLKRILRSADMRPLLEGKNEAELSEYIKKTLVYREKFYGEANYTVDADKDISDIIKSEPFNF